MKLFNVIAAYKIFYVLSSLKLPFSLRREIKFLKDWIFKEFEFYCEEEEKIINEYAEKDNQGNFIIENGKVKIDNQEDFFKCSELLKKLKNTEINFLNPKIKISQDLLINQNISLDEEEIFDFFVEFGDN